MVFYCLSKGNFSLFWDFNVVLLQVFFCAFHGFRGAAIGSPLVLFCGGFHPVKKLFMKIVDKFFFVHAENITEKRKLTSLFYSFFTLRHFT